MPSPENSAPEGPGGKGIFPCADCTNQRAMENDYLCFPCRKRKEGDKGELYEVSIERAREKFAPPEDLMRLTRIGDEVFFEVIDYIEDHLETRQRLVWSYSVNLRNLKQALDALNV